MYEDYWQLAAKPFESTFDSRFFYQGESQQAALHKLRYAIESRRSAVLLAGPSGIGKTLLGQALSDQSGAGVGPFVRVVFPLMSSRDFLIYLAEELGAPPCDPPQLTTEESLRRLEFFLDENARSGKHAVVVVDEAHLLEDSGLLETLRLLLNFQHQGQPALTLLLIGQLPLLSAMRRFTALDDRLDMKILLKPFALEETSGYLERRLEAAGATRSLFSPEAVQMVHQLSQGIPRKINRLCDLALVVGCAAGQHTIEAAQLQSVSDELLTVSSAAA